MILEIDPNFPQPAVIEQVIEIIKANHGIFAYPTDTVYGLGCDISDRDAVRKLIAVKQRPQDKNFSIIVADMKMLKEYAVVNSKQEKLMQKYLPGPFMFILKASKKLPQYLVGRNGTIGIRIPRNRLCHDLVESLGKPIITTSFNTSNNPVITNPLKTGKVLYNKIDVILDGGELGSLGSTIVDLLNDKIAIIRKGIGIL